MKKHEKRRDAADVSWQNAGMSAAKGVAIAVLFGAFTLLFGAFLVSFGGLKERWLDGIVLTCCLLGCLAGGWYAARSGGGRSLWIGLGVGGVTFLLLVCAGMLVYGDVSLEGNGMGILCACLCGGGISGFFSRKSKKKRRR